MKILSERIRKQPKFEFAIPKFSPGEKVKTFLDEDATVISLCTGIAYFIKRHGKKEVCIYQEDELRKISPVRRAVLKKS